jgi:DNA-binding GntR family transcriptional regulator
MSTVDRVERSVIDDLLRGVLAPGTRIRQDALAAELGVSKIPVREALQRLSAVGLLQFETNRGATVPALSVAEAQENSTLRAAIEVQLLRQAIPNLTIVDLAEAELAHSNTEMGVAESNWAFHRALYRASGWTRGLAIVEILHAAVAPYVLLYVESLGGAQDSDAEHSALLESCRVGDVDAAVALLQTHLAEAADAVVNFLAATETAVEKRP